MAGLEVELLAITASPGGTAAANFAASEPAAAADQMEYEKE